MSCQKDEERQCSLALPSSLFNVDFTWNDDDTAVAQGLLLSIAENGRPSSLPRSAKGCALLAYLILRDRSETREHLADLLWGAPDTAGSLRNLRVLLTGIRPYLPGLVKTRSSDRYPPQPNAAIDYLTLADLLTTGRNRPSLDDLRLFRGEPLEGYYLEDAPRYMEWLTLEREGCAGLFLTSTAACARSWPMISFGRRARMLPPTGWP